MLDIKGLFIPKMPMSLHIGREVEIIVEKVLAFGVCNSLKVTGLSEYFN